LFILHPADESIGSPVLAAKMKNLKFKNSILGYEALIQGKKNTNFEMADFAIENIQAEGRGTVIFVDLIEKGNSFKFLRGSLTRNKGNQGGVFHATQGSKVIFEEVIF